MTNLDYPNILLETRKPPHTHPFQKALCIILGTIALAGAIIGLILPLLPATPFVMLSAACYMKGSSRLGNKLQASKLYHATVGLYQEKKGMTRKTKLAILIPVLILLSIMFISTESTIIKVLAATLATAKTIVFTRIRTIPSVKENHTA